MSWNIELEAAVSQLPANVKQAFYAAANKGPIARGTWSHCAFNAGGKEIGNDAVNSFASAAKAFDVPEELVHEFISAWDKRQGTPEEATEYLKRAILAAGLFENPIPGKKIVRVMVYERQVEQLETLEAAGLIDNIDTAGELLSV